jgi:hypothetical protein
MKLVSDLFLIVVVLVSAVWCISNPSYEPALALLSSTSALLARAVAVFRSRETSLLIGRLLLPIRRWKDRHTPQAALEFDSLSGTRAIHHYLKAWSVWDGNGPTMWMELKHRQDTGSWTTPYRFEGYSIELEALDVDGDGRHEVVIRYACGAHTRVVNIFKVDFDGFLVPIPGAEVGSDWPEILLEDRDSDGRVEIYAKQRDWDRVPTQDPITEVYVYHEGKFQRKHESPNNALQATCENARV